MDRTELAASFDSFSSINLVFFYSKDGTELAASFLTITFIVEALRLDIPRVHAIA